MPLFTAIVALFIWVVLVGIVVAKSRIRRRLGFGLALALIGLPAQVETEPLIIYVFSLAVVMVVLRAWDLVRSNEGIPAWQRVWHLSALFDTRLTERIPRSIRWRDWARGLIGEGIALAALWLILSSTDLVGPARWAVRYGGFAIFMLAAFEGGPALLRALYGLLGIDLPRMHDRPYLSRSIQEFWGARWNQIISTWLRENCHAPLASRGRPWLGVVWAFVFSGVFHAYMMLTSMGWRWAVLNGGFFAVQIVLIQVERWLGVRRWSTVPARVWTVGLLLAISPMFTEPMIQLLEGFAVLY